MAYVGPAIIVLGLLVLGLLFFMKKDKGLTGRAESMERIRKVKDGELKKKR